MCFKMCSIFTSKRYMYHNYTYKSPIGRELFSIIETYEPRKFLELIKRSATVFKNQVAYLYTRA